MKALVAIGLLLAGNLAFAKLSLSEGLGSTLLRRGEITSSGDEGLQRREEPNQIELALKEFGRNPMLNCKTTEGSMLIELTGSFDSWANTGLARIVVPGEAGGAKVIYLESYERFTHIDPKTHEITMRVASHMVDKRNVQTDTLLLDVTLVPKGSKLVFTNVEFSLAPRNGGIFAFGSRGEIRCSWGAGRTYWD